MNKRSTWVFLINITLAVLVAIPVYRDLTFGKGWGLISPPLSQILRQEGLSIAIIAALFIGAIMQVVARRGAATVNIVTSALLICLYIRTTIRISHDGDFWRQFLVEVVPIFALLAINIVLCGSSRPRALQN